jgi:Ca-activated chloride channel family protein
VVLFSGAFRLMTPSSIAATPDNIRRAINTIDHERGGGGTELEGALQIAMKLPRQPHVSRTIAVFTDGYIAEEPGAFKMVHENLHDTNLFAFGIGSSVNRHLIEGLARAGQGEPFVVLDPTQADTVGAQFRRTVETPVLTNVQVKAEGFDMFDIEPAVQPDLFAERPVLLFGKWHGPATGRLIVTGYTPAGEFRQAVDVADHASRPENEALPRLWARTRIARLSDYNFDVDADEATRQVTNLGLTYSLVTKHTSFLAVLDQVRNHSGAGKDVTQPVPLPQGVSELAVDEQQSYGSGAEPEVWLLMLILGWIALGSAAWKRRRAMVAEGQR